MSWQTAREETNQALFDNLYPERAKRAQIYLALDCSWIHKELARKGVNLSLLWNEYQVNCANAGRISYQYTQFCEIYRNWARKSKATMRIHHKRGDAMQVDWAGDTLPIKDPATGEKTDAYLFVAVLPCICFAYAELCDNERSEIWLLCHVPAYEYFGGVARLLIPDNLKTGVTRNTRLERNCKICLHLDSGRFTERNFLLFS